MPDLGWGPPQRTHRDHDAEYRSHDAQAGQGVCHGAERLRGHHAGVVMDLQIEFHHLLDVEGLHAAGHGHAHGVAYKGTDVMILEKGWIFGKDRALVGLFDVSFDRD